MRADAMWHRDLVDDVLDHVSQKRNFIQPSLKCAVSIYWQFSVIRKGNSKRELNHQMKGVVLFTFKIPMKHYFLQEAFFEGHRPR